MNFLQRLNRNCNFKFIVLATILSTILIFTKFQPTNASVSIVYAERLNNSLKTISNQLVINTSLLENDLNYSGTLKMNIIPILDVFILPFFKNKNMNISLVTVGKTNTIGHLLYSQAVTWRLKNDTYFTMSFGRTLIRNTNYEIMIHFFGKFHDNTYDGYYASSYVSKNNVKSWYTLTENNIDRNQCAFPCSYEINEISNLQLILGHHKNVSAISNVGNSYLVSEDDEFIQERFSYPFNIPYHGVAFSINNFSNMTMEKVAIWSTLDSKQYLNYALNIGSKLLKFYETIFHHEYEINKCNIIAVPNTVNYITENYGLIKIQEDFLFYVEHISTDSKKAEVSLLMGHILGNAYMIPLSYLIPSLVKEDIVTYFKYSLIDRFDSNLQITNQYGILELQRILEIDASYHHTNANMIDDRKFHLMNEHIIIADFLSYTKNAAVLRMFESLLKTERFHQSLTEFFLINRLTNAENRLTEYFEKLLVHLNDDLKFELSQRSSTINTKEFNVTKILQKWFQQKGYPIVHVKIDDNQIIFEQEKFNYYSFDYSLYIDDDDHNTDDNIDNNSNINNITWWIPISFTTSYELNFNEKFPKYWLPFKSQIAYPLMLYENDWYLLNLYRTGFYRVNYDIKNWKYLINLLNTRLNINMIPSPIRSQLIDDALNLARANYIPYALAFNLTNYLENEIEYIPWKSALYCFDFIRAMLDTSENENYNFETYVSFLMKKIYLKINMKNINNNDYIERQHDFDILRSACDYGVSDCALTSVAMLGHWRTKSKPDINNPIPKLLKPIVYCASIKYGTESEWKFIFRRFQIMSTYNDEKKILLLSLGCSRDEEILTNFLNIITYGNEQFYNLYKTLIFNYISKTSFGRKVIVNFLKNETDNNKIKKGFTSTSDYIEVLQTLFQRMNTLTEHIHVKKIMSIITNHNDIKTLEKSIQISARNIRWMDRFGDIIKDLAKNNLNRLMKTNRTLV